MGLWWRTWRSAEDHKFLLLIRHCPTEDDAKNLSFIIFMRQVSVLGGFLGNFWSGQLQQTLILNVIHAELTAWMCTTYTNGKEGLKKQQFSTSSFGRNNNLLLAPLSSRSCCALQCIFVNVWEFWGEFCQNVCEILHTLTRFSGIYLTEHSLITAFVSQMKIMRSSLTCSRLGVFCPWEGQCQFHVHPVSLLRDNHPHVVRFIKIIPFHGAFDCELHGNYTEFLKRNSRTILCPTRPLGRCWIQAVSAVTGTNIWKYTMNFYTNTVTEIGTY